MKRPLWLAALAAFVLTVAACGDSNGGDTTSAAPTTGAETTEGTEAAVTTEGQVTQTGLSIGVATHENPGDSDFWGIVKKGAEDAGSQLGIEINVQGDGDVAVQAQIVETFVTQGVDGVVVSLANPEGMTDAVRAAVDAGIPVITINSGVDVFRDLGAMTHVGQTETVAGEGAGLRFNDIGATKVLCVIHEEANIGLEQRCDGLESTFDGEIERFSVASTGTGDIAGTLGTIQDKVTSDESIDGVLTLNPNVAVAARDAIADGGVGDRVTLGTFDLSPDVLGAVEAGEISFAIDQQPYLQGYLPVVFIKLFYDNANSVGGGNPVLTGPGFVTVENAAAVKALADAGTR